MGCCFQHPGSPLYTSTTPAISQRRGLRVVGRDNEDVVGSERARGAVVVGPGCSRGEELLRYARHGLHLLVRHRLIALVRDLHEKKPGAGEG